MRAVGGPDSAAGPMAKGKGDAMAKSRKPQHVKKAKSTFHLTVDASRRLDIHATMVGLDRSCVVEQLINQHLRRFYVFERGGEEQGAQSVPIQEK
jgi:hypothetical protein